MSRLQHFGWFLSRGFGPHGWGHPSYDWEYTWHRPELYQQSVRALEQAGFDLVIIEDALSLGNADTLDLRIRSAYGGPKHDPLLLAPYLFDVTQHIGIAPTVNPLAYSPYQAARQFATLQHLSDYRFGINVVTDVGSSRHFRNRAARPRRGVRPGRGVAGRRAAAVAQLGSRCPGERCGHGPLRRRLEARRVPAPGIELLVRWPPQRAPLPRPPREPAKSAL